jgi:hypothetical protein
MSMFNEDDLDQIESVITLRECCQSGCTVCVLDYPASADVQLHARQQADLLDAVLLACALVDEIEPGIHEV